ncbi:hypothetical protein BSPLISOX_3151 [uncultured Gammaproteobacteria bacterium]|nr:hypothetical protein [uncultured Gammaproteobacteria bacterium]VVH67188.1 hypothetical protein BSPLISOX_3151 [uncultured Gammaproteobacteria bacterium]
MIKMIFLKIPMSIMSYSLPISLIRQYCFCPRIPYFQELLKLNPKRPQWVKQGEKLHQQQQKVFKHRTLKRFNLEHAIQTFDEFVTSDSFALHGVVDSFLNDEENIYPIEFKLSGNKPMKGQILQLTAYGLLLQEKYNLPCQIGFILYENKGKTHQINFDKNRIQQVVIIRDKILSDLDNSYMPDSPATPAQCTQCEYLNHCNDR